MHEDFQVHFHLEIESDAYFHSPHTIIYTASHRKFMNVFYFHFQSNIHPMIHLKIQVKVLFILFRILDWKS